MNVISAKPLWCTDLIEASMVQSDKSSDSLAWALLRVCFFFLLGIATPLSLIALIIHLAVNGLYSFSAIPAVFLTFLILWLSSPLIVFFAYAVCSLRDRWRKPSQQEVSGKVPTIDGPPQSLQLTLYVDRSK